MTALMIIAVIGLYYVLYIVSIYREHGAWLVSYSIFGLSMLVILILGYSPWSTDENFIENKIAFLFIGSIVYFFIAMKNVYDRSLNHKIATTQMTKEEYESLSYRRSIMPYKAKFSLIAALLMLALAVWIYPYKTEDILLECVVPIFLLVCLAGVIELVIGLYSLFIEKYFQFRTFKYITTIAYIFVIMFIIFFKLR
ncbi:hypothetical protein ROU88_10915 [Macrococcus capreoli]